MIRNKKKWYQFHAGTQGDLERVKKRALQLIKSDIENSNDKLSFINHRATVLAQAKLYLV